MDAYAEEIIQFIKDGDEEKALKDFIYYIKEKGLSASEQEEILRVYDKNLFEDWERKGKDTQWLIHQLTLRLQGIRIYNADKLSKPGYVPRKI